MKNLEELRTVNLEMLPFALDRASAWEQLREAGEVVNGQGEVILTDPRWSSLAARVDRAVGPPPPAADRTPPDDCCPSTESMTAGL